MRWRCCGARAASRKRVTRGRGRRKNTNSRVSQQAFPSQDKSEHPAKLFCLDFSNSLPLDEPGRRTMTWETHDISNQYDELTDYNLYATDAPLRQPAKKWKQLV